MKAVIRDPKTPPTRLQTRHSGSSKMLASPWEAVNLIDAVPTTVTKCPQGRRCLAFSAASLGLVQVANLLRAQSLQEAVA